MDPVSDQLGSPSRVGCHHRRFERHGLEHGIWCSFVIRRLNEEVERVVQADDIFDVTGEAAEGCQTTRAGVVRQRVLELAVSRDDNEQVGKPLQ